MKLSLSFTCIEERASDSGQRAKLTMPVPPPLPVVDGYGNPVAHPPPASGDLRLFVTSEARQGFYYEIDKLERKSKALRPHLVVDEAHKKEVEAEKSEVEKKLSSLRTQVRDLKEFRLEHGERYIVTIEKAPKEKAR